MASSSEKNQRHVEVPWLAKPSGDCCLTGHMHVGSPRGAFETIAEVDTYVVHPPEGKANGNIMLYYADVFGMFTNAQLVMDEYANAGYLTLGLDYFQNDPIFLHRSDAKTSKEGFDFAVWLEKYTGFADKKVPEWTAAVKQKYGKADTKYACVGYCFGAPYVCNSLADGTCQVGGFAHPAFLKEHHFRNLKAPLFLSCAEIDHTFGTDSRNEAVSMMIEDGRKYGLELYSGVAHGFALRANLDVPYERWVKEQSLASIVAYCNFWLLQ
ncbi:Putative dienelactone hydrolase, alpha/Beta hydrolase [Septoria linicola]|uniref:Dienelactone hydrolase, alpha/Beta hydrolase n=1 Tax=Septoria linicola TaxID=215465 RepID=A0A9Q9ELJ6_9PEZI|nr:putative dienelactone hydrolase, alpha/Beta hydrolase [Septoria linicola]USW54467.1 Putative dienelactone hydrolase, alpha/Beta hydrolase [Septoria linicola]